MTFQWSEIQIEMNPITFRYFNDMIWYFYAIASIIPEVFITFHKLYLHIFDKQQHKNNEGNQLSNKICYFFTYWGPFYYSFDIMISVWEGTFYHRCRFPYVFHHLIAITIQPFLLNRRIYQWWDVLLCACHGIIVLFPKSFALTVVYVGSILNFNVWLYFDRPTWTNKFLFKIFPFIYYSFYLIGVSEDCDSSLPYLAE